MASTEGTQPLDASERAELLRLRAQVAESAAVRHRGMRNALRWTLSGFLIFLVAVLMLGSLVAGFARSEILDTDRYVQTVTPLASEPAVQADVADQVTRQLSERLDIEKITAEALTALTETAPRVPSQVVGLAPVIAGQAEGFIHQTVMSVLGTEQFERAWVDANRIAHQKLVAVATGDTSVVEIDDKGTVSLPLGPIVENVTTALSERGFAFADKVPSIDTEFVLFQSPDLVKAQRVVRALDRAATWLPWLAVAAAVGAVFAAPRGRRLRALSLVGLGVAVATALLGLSLNVARSVYIDEIPSDVLSPAAASAIVDTVSVPLKTMLRAFFALGLVVALVGYLTGGSHSALAVRGGFGRGVDALRRMGSDRPARPYELWAARLRVPLRVAIGVVAVAILLFWRYPTGLVVALVALGAVVALVVLEAVARPGVVAAEAAADVATDSPVDHSG
ncbi:hypothetical protein [Rhodococcus kronopolitis]|uniref:Integral membrane protein n=1 Tax=Rhodococcus kronopolitis TaxID=1460226 RepID=A0ABV9G060_9NOCA